MERVKGVGQKTDAGGWEKSTQNGPAIGGMGKLKLPDGGGKKLELREYLVQGEGWRRFGREKGQAAQV